MAESSGVVGRALLWATAISFLVFLLLSSVFVGNLGPIPALIVSPIAFVASFVVFWIVESLLEPHTESVRKITYFALSLILLAPLVTYVASNYREFTRAGRMEHATRLTDSERQLLKSTRINLRVAVADPSEKPATIRSLIHDLQAICLFADVKEFDGLENTDVLATIKGKFWDDKVGQNFVFHLPGQPSEGVEIRVFYKLGPALPWVGRRSVRRQYFERLSVELIKASQTLFGQNQPSSIDPIFVAPDKNWNCEIK